VTSSQVLCSALLQCAAEMNAVGGSVDAVCCSVSLR